MESTVPGGQGLQLSQEQINAAMKSPQHLTAWLDASQRRWLVFNGLDLVDALQHPWPGAVETFMQVVMAYRDHRRTITTGRTQRIRGVHPRTGEPYDHEVAVHRGELLEPEELDRCIRYLVGQMLQHDPSWSLDRPQL